MKEIAFVAVFVAVYIIVRPAIHKLFNTKKDEEK
jgi:hypothetical protein